MLFYARYALCTYADARKRYFAAVIDIAAVGFDIATSLHIATLRILMPMSFFMI